MDNVASIRTKLKSALYAKEFIVDKTGVNTIEIIGATFVADEPSIFGSINEDWNERERQWYLSTSLNVNDIPPPIPAIWKQVATPEGLINSNYGWCILSKDNYSQYENALGELKRNPDSRRAAMIYNRPSMWVDYNLDGRSDFMCTFATQHFIRNGKLITHVTMRSNDAIFGYKGDYAWQKYVHSKLANDLDVAEGDIIWTVGSLHVYERHFNLVQ